MSLQELIDARAAAWAAHDDAAAGTIQVLIDRFYV